MYIAFNLVSRFWRHRRPCGVIDLKPSNSKTQECIVLKIALETILLLVKNIKGHVPDKNTSNAAYYTIESSKTRAWCADPPPRIFSIQTKNLNWISSKKFIKLSYRKVLERIVQRTYDTILLLAKILHETLNKQLHKMEVVFDLLKVISVF